MKMMTKRSKSPVSGKKLRNHFRRSIPAGLAALCLLLSGWDGNQQTNYVYVLNDQMQVTGQIDGLAPGEMIYSARFMGDIGYFVTYRNVDPLFAVDLSDPENPRIIGQLKVTGFSDYLHFYGEDRLLGIGWETNPETGEQTGGFVIEEKKHSSHKGVLESVYCISWEVPAQEGQTGRRKCRICVKPA